MKEQKIAKDSSFFSVVKLQQTFVSGWFAWLTSFQYRLLTLHNDHYIRKLLDLYMMSCAITNWIVLYLV